MKRPPGHLLVCALLIAGAVLAAAGTASGRSDSLSRPLHLPHVAAGAPLPGLRGRTGEHARARVSRACRWPARARCI